MRTKKHRIKILTILEWRFKFSRFDLPGLTLQPGIFGALDEGPSSFGNAFHSWPEGAARLRERQRCYSVLCRCMVTCNHCLDVPRARIRSFRRA